MKLKLRVWICAAALIAATVITFLLSAANLEPTVDDPEYIIRQAEDRLNHVYGEFGAGGDNVDILIKALIRLTKHSSDEELVAKWPPSGETKRSGTGERPLHVEIAQKLLRDRSFNVAENVEVLIKLGKTLEKSVQKSGVGRNESGEAFGDETSREVYSDGSRRLDEGEANSGFGRYPEFRLNDEIVTAFSQHIASRMDTHKRLRRIGSMHLTYQVHKGKKLHNWQLWQNGIGKKRLYDGTSPLIDELLKDMTYGRITGMSTMADYGTQIKLVFKYDDKSQALFKPMRWRRDQERDPNLFYFDDFERHHAEIAAFHLDRLMEFYRVPPNVGRFINITADIEPFASKPFLRTLFTSPAGNKCFYGKCDYYCDSGHPVCGKPDVIEGSLAAWLPFTSKLVKKTWENPWKRSYSKFRTADWEHDPDYCEEVKVTKPYNNGRRLLDLIDITIFDYLAGNQDRHHYHTFKLFGNNSSPVLYDNGRGFGWIIYDDRSILTPLIQCCEIRFSTLVKLMRFETGPKKLGVLMAESLNRDPLSSGPNGLILSDGHLKALDRRVSRILDTVWDCVRRNGITKVVLDDGI